MRPWTEEDTQELRDLIKEGLSWTQISRKIGRSRNSVAGKITRMNGTNTFRKKRSKPRVWDTNHGSWDSRTFLPYAEWKMWKRSQRKKREAEGIQDDARPDHTGWNQSHSSERSPGVREV